MINIEDKILASMASHSISSVHGKILFEKLKNPEQLKVVLEFFQEDKDPTLTNLFKRLKEISLDRPELISKELLRELVGSDL